MQNSQQGRELYFFNMTEFWRDVIWYKWIYQVSQDWKVKNIQTGKILKTKISKFWYENIILSKNCKRSNLMVHRLVAIAFIDNPHNYEQVNHIDWNKSNNTLSNLEWCSRSQNVIHAYRVLWRVRVWEKPVLQYTMDWVLLAKYKSIKDASLKTNIDATNICRAAKWERKHAYWYKFEYA